MKRKRKLELANNYLFVLLAVAIALFMVFYEYAEMTNYGKNLDQDERAAFAIVKILVFLFVYIAWGVFLAALAVVTGALTASLKRELAEDAENPVAGRKNRIAILVLKCIATVVIGVMIYVAFNAEWATVLNKIVYCVAAACGVASVAYGIYFLRENKRKKEEITLEKGEE